MLGLVVDPVMFPPLKVVQSYSKVRLEGVTRELRVTDRLIQFSSRGVSIVVRTGVVSAATVMVSKLTQWLAVLVTASS